MSGTIAVVDTNVVVAGLLTSDSTSPVARILDGMLGASFPFAVSEALIAEYRDVLSRPRLRKAHGLAPREVEAIVVELAQHAIVLAPGRARVAPDSGDQFLWGLLAARAELVLVSGDVALLGDPAMRGRVMSPRSFIEGSLRKAR